MTAEPIRPAADASRSPAAIRDALLAADRAGFAAAYAGALDEARRTWSLQPVDEVLEHWRMIAFLSRNPHHKAAIEDGLRLAAGEDIPLYEVDLDALRRGERPATWPATV